MPDASFSATLARRGGEHLLSWVEFALTLAYGSPATPTIYTWSDVDIPQANRLDEARILEYSAIIRELSDESGAPTPGRFGWRQSDTDHLVRTWLADPAKKYFLERNVAIRIIPDAQRRLGYTPRLVARGLVSNYKLQQGTRNDALQTQFEARDFLSRVFEELIPRRTIDSGRFPDADVDTLGLGVPIIIGRVSDQDAVSPTEAHGRVTLIPVGTEVIDSVTHTVLLAAGHALKEWEQVFVDGVEVVLDGGGADAFFFVPGHDNWDGDPTNFPTTYRDKSGHRFALAYVATGHADYAAILDGSKQVTANVKGMEDEGDGTGILLDEYFVGGYLTAFLYNHAFEDQLYLTGTPYSASPFFSELDGSLTKIDSSGFITQRIETTFLWKMGVVIGANGERQTLGYWISLMNFGGGVSMYWNKSFQYAITRLGLTGGLPGAQAVDHTNDIIEPFEMDDDVTLMRNVVEFDYAYDYSAGVWGVGGNRWEANDFIAAYQGKRFVSPCFQLTTIQDRFTAERVMLYWLATHVNPPRLVSVRSGLYLLEDDVGSVRLVTHEDGISASGYVAQTMQIARQELHIDGVFTLERLRDLSTIPTPDDMDTTLYRGCYAGECGSGCGGQWAGPGVTQVYAGRNTGVTSASTEVWFSPHMFGYVPISDAEAKQLVMADETYSHLAIKLAVAPGVGNSAVFTFVKWSGVGSATPTSLTVTISGTDTEGSNTTDSVSVAPGDFIAMKVVTDYADTPFYFSASLARAGTEAGVSTYGTLSASGFDAVSTRLSAFSPTTFINHPTANFFSLVPTAGDMLGYGIHLTTTPGGGKDRTFTVYLNGVAQDGSGGTVDTQLVFTDAVFPTATASFVLPLVPGDRVNVQEDASGSPTASFVSYCAVFKAAVDGESMVCAAQVEHMTGTGSSTRYQMPTSDATGGWGFTTEAPVQFIGPVGTPFVLRDFHVRMDGPPTTSADFDTRVNGASPGGTPAVSYTSAESGVKTDATGEVTISNGDLWNMRCVIGAGSMFFVRSNWSWAQFIQR